MLALRLGLATMVLLSTLLAGSLMGDDKTDPKDPPPKLKGTLPANYKKLALDDKQIQDIYRIEADYRAKIDGLQQKIVDLKKDEKSDFEKVLTKAQKDRLKEIRDKDVTPDKDPAKDPAKKDPVKEPSKDPVKDPAK